mmetsp:Transcript_6826/g.11310  ORF Transcript_6826/g.11310 Transcript_6826/m.11310 type:complete len:333 (+) Transcript_6826:67-1065(+)
MMNYLLIAYFTLVLGLVGDINARAVGGRNDKMDRESLPGMKLLKRRVAQEQADEASQFFQIYISIQLPYDDGKIECNVTEQAEIDDAINKLLIDFRFGDVGNNADPAAGIWNTEPAPDAYDPNADGAADSFLRVTNFAYNWYRSGSCVFCGLPNPDNNRMLLAATTVDGLSLTVKSAILTTLLPNHPTCFGLEWTVQVTVKEVTAAAIEVYCAYEILSEYTPVTSVRPLVPPVAKPTVEWTYELPDWWDMVIEHEGDDYLKKCKRREEPPRHGKKCPRRTKTCYWGNQQCDDVDGKNRPVTFPYATTSCHCDGTVDRRGRWSCENVACPKIP